MYSSRSWTSTKPYSLVEISTDEISLAVEPVTVWVEQSFKIQLLVGQLFSLGYTLKNNIAGAQNNVTPLTLVLMVYFLPGRWLFVLMMKKVVASAKA